MAGEFDEREDCRGDPRGDPGDLPAPIASANATSGGGTNMDLKDGDDELL